MPLNADRVRVGPFELDVRAAELLRDGVRVRLQEQPLRVLVALVERHGEVVSREELRQRLWPADTFVDFERSLNAAVKRLREALGESADTPHYIETLPRHGYRLITRVEPLATARPSQLEVLIPAVPDPPAASPARPRWRWWMVGGAALVALATAATLWFWPGSDGQPTTAAVSPLPGLDPEKVVVAVFANRTGDASLETLGLQVSDWVTHSLFRMNARVAVNPDLLAFEDRGLPPPAVAGEADVIRGLAERTGAGLVVSGAYYLDGERLRVQGQLIDASSGAIAVALEPSVGPRSRSGDVVADVARVVMGAMAVRLDVAIDPGDGAAIRPPVYEAFVEWERGLASENPAEQERHWRRSVELDPTFVMPRVRLAHLLTWVRGQTWSPRYRDSDELLRPIEEPAMYGRATPYEQTQIRHMRGMLDGDWGVHYAGAVEAARLVPTVWNLYLRAGVELRTRRPHAALDTLSRIRAEDALAAVTTRPGDWLYRRALLHHELGQYERELADARLGQQHYPAAGWFFNREIGALIGLGRLAEIESAISRSEQATLRVGSVGHVLLDASRELDAHGHADPARAMAVRAVAWYRNRVAFPTQPGAADLRGDYANALIHADDCQGVAVRRAIMQEAPDGLFERSNYATALVACGGSRDEARRIAETLARLDRPFLRGLHLYCSARILAALGDGEAAVRALDASHSRGWGFDQPELHLNYAWKPIRDYPPFQEWLKPRD